MLHTYRHMCHGYMRHCYMRHGYMHHGYMHCGYMHRGYMDNGYIHRGYMHRGYMDNGYMHHGYIHHRYMHYGYMHHGYMLHGDMHHGHICVGHTAWVPEGRKGRSQAGPKGRKLEVGAQRAAKLLVFHIWNSFNIKDRTCPTNLCVWQEINIFRCTQWRARSFLRQKRSPTCSCARCSKKWLRDVACRIWMY